jgi:hypothetical protein
MKAPPAVSVLADGSAGPQLALDLHAANLEDAESTLCLTPGRLLAESVSSMTNSLTNSTVTSARRPSDVGHRQDMLVTFPLANTSSSQTPVTSARRPPEAVPRQDRQMPPIDLSNRQLPPIDLSKSKLTNSRGKAASLVQNYSSL